MIHNINMKGYTNKCWVAAVIANGFHIKSSHHPLTILISYKKGEIRNKKIEIIIIRRRRKRGKRRRKRKKKKN